MAPGACVELHRGSFPCAWPALVVAPWLSQQTSSGICRCLPVRPGCGARGETTGGLDSHPGREGSKGPVPMEASAGRTLAHGGLGGLCWGGVDQGSWTQSCSTSLVSGGSLGKCWEALRVPYRLLLATCLLLTLCPTWRGLAACHGWLSCPSSTACSPSLPQNQGVVASLVPRTHTLRAVGSGASPGPGGEGQPQGRKRHLGPSPPDSQGHPERPPSLQCLSPQRPCSHPSRASGLRAWLRELPVTAALRVLSLARSTGGVSGPQTSEVIAPQCKGRAGYGGAHWCCQPLRRLSENVT